MGVTTEVPSRDRASSPRPGWWPLTLTGAAVLTLLDAFLIQQKKAFFTGGFLAEDHAAGLADGVGFLLLSLLSDAAVVGIAVAAASMLFAGIRLTRLARAMAVLMTALMPLVVADFVSYRLVEYLGDAFDLSLMFDLAGRSLAEMFAVAAPHLVAPALAMLALGTVAGGLVWAVNRGRQTRAHAIRVPRSVLASSAALCLIGLAGTAVARAYSDVMDNGLRRKPSGKVLGLIARMATDVDRDGFGVGGAMSDFAPFDATLFPYAVDIPGNGLDENGVGGDLPAGLAPYTEPGNVHSSWLHKPDLVLIVLESFRGDIVGSRLNGKAVTPTLDGLARGGLSVAHAFSHNGYTTQSRLHLMSGSLAGLRGPRTLVDDFKSNGYEVAYVSGQDESFGGPSAAVGFERADFAFDARQARHRRYSTFTTAGSLAVPFDVVLEQVAGFLESRRGDRPLFLYVNLHDTHYPYWHAGMRPLVSSAILPEAAIVPARASELREMYANAAANVDRAIGELLETVRRHLPSPPAIIVTADHGESLYDAGFLGHGYALNDAQTRIPFIAANLPVTVDEPFGQAELRDVIGAALASPSPATPPQRRRPPGKVVFQYLGNLDRPRQIAFTSERTRTIYDFRRRQVQFGDSPWIDPGHLDGERLDSFLAVVHFWERMVLARSTSRQGSDE